MPGRQRQLLRHSGTAASGERCRLRRGCCLRATSIAFFETFLVKSYETLGDSDTRVDVNTGIVTASRLQAAIGPTNYSIDIAEMVARFPLGQAGFAQAARQFESRR